MKYNQIFPPNLKRKYINGGVDLEEKEQVIEDSISLEGFLDDNEPTSKWAAKASVFTNLFSELEYTFKLYCALHPEDTSTTKDDLMLMTMESHLLNQQYNDLFDNHLNDLKDVHKKAIIKPLYEKILGKEDIINLNLAEEYFDKFNKNKLKILEEYLCWRIYRYFFLDFLAAKLCE